MLLRLHDLVLDRQAEILDLICWESGKARKHAFDEPLHIALTARYYGKTAEEHLATKRVPGLVPGLTRVDVHHHPKGVVGIVSPWNYPFTLALCDGKGARVLRCRYHGWTYGLDGVLRAAPEMGKAAGFVPAAVRLPELRVGTWHGLCFAGAAAAPPFEDFVRGMDAPLRSLSPQHYHFHGRTSYDIACNWKVYCDNYLEGYHVPHIHPGLNSLLDYRQYVTECGDWFSYQYSPLESDPALYGDGDALYYFIYPNTMLNLLPGRLQTNRVLPLGADRCIVEFDYYYAPDDSAQAEARKQADHDFAHQVQDEDIEICEHVQRGLTSGSYVPGRLNPLRENAVFHYHELLRAAYRAVP